MIRQFSGIQPTGDMHLGNYVGAVQRWVDQQDDGIFCVVDLHAMTTPYDPAELTAGTSRLAALLLAAGLDPARCTLFVQSHVPVVTELTWILNGVATFGELGRMTQFKEKGAGRESVSAGLFDYPVLMAADILLYDTDEVPVGEDQVQHVELTRDVAIRFNHRFGDTLVVPKATLPPVGARIKDLQNPTAKMSKSVESPQGTILVLDEPKVITKKVKSAVTDSDTAVRFDVEAKPGVSNLLSLLSVATGRPIPDLEVEFGTSGYGTFKGAVADALVEYLRPTRERYQELAADPAELARLLARGAARANTIAETTMTRVRARDRVAAAGMTGQHDAPRRFEREGTGLEFDRVAFFSDAVYAIAMTLLVVGVGVPHVRDANLGKALSDVDTEILSFFIGFFVLGYYWLSHHSLVAQLRAVNTPFMAVNLLYLAVVAFLPFLVAVAGSHRGVELAFVLFAIALATVSFLEVGLYLVATRYDLGKERPTPGQHRHDILAGLLPGIFFVLSLPVAFVDISLAYLVWLLTFPAEIVLDRLVPDERRA